MTKPSQQRAAKASDPTQSAAFIKKAREIGADEESSVLSDALIKRLARTPPARKSKAAAK